MMNSYTMEGSTMDGNKEQQIELSQLRWHCRRGVKELDVVLRNYLDNHYLASSETLKQAFKAILNIEDPVLLSLVMNQHQLEDSDLNIVLDKIKKPY